MCWSAVPYVFCGEGYGNAVDNSPLIQAPTLVKYNGIFTHAGANNQACCQGGQPREQLCEQPRSNLQVANTSDVAIAGLYFVVYSGCEEHCVNNYPC